MRRRLCSWKFARPLINPRELSCLSTSAAYTCLRVSFRDDRSGSHHVPWQPLRRRWFLRIVFEDEVKAPCRAPPAAATLLPDKIVRVVAGVLSSNEGYPLPVLIFEQLLPPRRFFLLSVSVFSVSSIFLGFSHLERVFTRSYITINNAAVSLHDAALDQLFLHRNFLLSMANSDVRFGNFRTGILVFLWFR